MEFYLPIAQPLTAGELMLDSSIRPLSAGCPALDFSHAGSRHVKGLYRLVFRWRGRQLPASDYKSNWLGEDSAPLIPRRRCGCAMQAHRYDLQYQLYTLALQSLAFVIEWRITTMNAISAALHLSLYA